MDSGDSLLVVTIRNLRYFVTEKELHLVFDSYGHIDSLDLFHAEDYDYIQALIWFRSSISATLAKSFLQGRCIYEGCCQMDIEFYNQHFKDPKIEEDKIIFEQSLELKSDQFSDLGTVDQLVIVGDDSIEVSDEEISSDNAEILDEVSGEKVLQFEEIEEEVSESSTISVLPSQISEIEDEVNSHIFEIENESFPVNSSTHIVVDRALFGVRIRKAFVELTEETGDNGKMLISESELLTEDAWKLFDEILTKKLYAIAMIKGVTEVNQRRKKKNYYVSRSPSKPPWQVNPVVVLERRLIPHHKVFVFQALRLQQYRQFSVFLRRNMKLSLRFYGSYETVFNGFEVGIFEWWIFGYKIGRVIASKYGSSRKLTDATSTGGRLEKLAMENFPKVT